MKQQWIEKMKENERKNKSFVVLIDEYPVVLIKDNPPKVSNSAQNFRSEKTDKKLCADNLI